MKIILITTLCFISIINAADDKKEIELKLGDAFQQRIFKGYPLDKKESAFVSFVGIHQNARFTIIRAEYRTDPECMMGTKGGYEEVLFDHAGFGSLYKNYDGYRYSSGPIDSNDGQDIDLNSMRKALGLCSFYFNIDGKRTLNIEKKSTSENEPSKE